MNFACPDCGSKSKVIRSSRTGHNILRELRCVDCRTTFKTREIPDAYLRILEALLDPEHSKLVARIRDAQE